MDSCPFGVELPYYEPLIEEDQWVWVIGKGGRRCRIRSKAERSMSKRVEGGANSRHIRLIPKPCATFVPSRST